MTKFIEVLLEPYDIALEQPPFGAGGLFPVAAAAPAHQISWVVGLGGIGEPPPRQDVVDGEFAPVLLLRLPTILAPVPIAGPDPLRALFPVRRQRQKWLMTILRMPNAGETTKTPCVRHLPSAVY